MCSLTFVSGEQCKDWGKENVYVANNVCWAVGKVVVKVCVLPTLQ